MSQKPKKILKGGAKMARPKKIISMQRGHIGKKARAQREYEEKLVATSKVGLEKVPPSLFLDAVAKKEYKRILEELQAIDIIGNLDRTNMISYANAYSIYVDTCKKMKEKDFRPVIETSSGMKKNPLYDIQAQALKTIESTGKQLGMSVSARLNIAASKAKQQEEELADMFGNI